MSRAAPRLRTTRATARDLPGLLGLEAHFPGDRLSARSLRHFLTSSAADFRVLRQGAGLSGAILVVYRRNSRRARIYSLVVAPAMRGQGLGQRLIRAAERAARRRGCTEMALEVRADNRPARRLYESLGYALQAQLPGYYSDGAPGLRLSRRL